MLWHFIDWIRLQLSKQTQPIGWTQVNCTWIYLNHHISLTCSRLSSSARFLESPLLLIGISIVAALLIILSAIMECYWKRECNKEKENKIKQSTSIHYKRLFVTVQNNIFIKALLIINNVDQTSLQTTNVMYYYRLTKSKWMVTTACCHST